MPSAIMPDVHEIGGNGEDTEQYHRRHTDAHEPVGPGGQQEPGEDQNGSWNSRHDHTNEADDNQHGREHQHHRRITNGAVAAFCQAPASCACRLARSLSGNQKNNSFSSRSRTTSVGSPHWRTVVLMSFSSMCLRNAST